jgi:ribonuclease HII
MVALDRDHPAYDFKTHKGYVTDLHNAALAEHGPCSQHRMRFVNVRRAAGLEPLADPVSPAVEPGETRMPSVTELVEGCAEPAGVSTRVGPRTSRGESA